MTTDTATKIISKHVDTLYWQFKQELDNNVIEHSSELARF